MKCVDFYLARIPDHQGRFLTEIQTWDFEQLEDVHDFIQWLFPLPERSPVNPFAPTLDQSDINEFLHRPMLRQALAASFRTMLAFYGFALVPGDRPRVERSEQFAERSRNWLSPGNHNHLRITRILRSLTLLGLESHARAFFETLAAIYEDEAKRSRRITPVTWGFWQAAIMRN